MCTSDGWPAAPFWPIRQMEAGASASVVRCIRSVMMTGWLELHRDTQRVSINLINAHDGSQEVTDRVRDSVDPEVGRPLENNDKWLLLSLSLFCSGIRGIWTIQKQDTYIREAAPPPSPWCVCVCD